MAPSTSSQQRVLGRYVLYGEIASGGMATVHYGRLLGVVGFSRTVAIKRLHPHYAKDPEVVSMFLDEARLAARIRHPNVVPTIDVVATDGEVFLVMEYVQGVPLSHLVRAATDMGSRIPARIVSSILVDALDGLHAAHEATSEHGEPLRLVHRDVSPQNVLVGVDGAARVLDFGVAKAIGRMQTTRDGQVKGKLAYMAPEHVTGREVSRASDVFAASVVLWEALTGKRLFFGGDDGQVIYRILNAPIEPPSHFAPDLPPSVDAVTMRGLARALSERFATAKEMARALEESLPPASTSDVGEYVQSVAGVLLGTRARELAAIESSSSSPAGQRVLLPPIESGAKAELDVEVEVGGLADEDAGVTALDAQRGTETDGKSASGWWRLGAPLAFVLAAGAGAAILMARRGAVGAAAPPSTASVAAPSAVASTSTDPPAPSASTVADAPPPSASAPPHRVVTRPPSHNAATGTCDPPYVIDSAGYKHYKRECVH